LEDANGDTSMDGYGQGNDSIYNNSVNGGSDTDNHDISDLRSTLPPKRALEGPQMTLEGQQLRNLLQHGQPSLIQEIRQHIGQHDTFQSFLELLTMYDAHLIDHLELVRRTIPFLGRDQPLLDRFKRGILDDRVDDDADTRVNDALTMSPSTRTSPSYLTPSTTKNNSNNSDADSTSAISVMSSGSLPSSYQPIHRNKDNSTSYRWIPKAVRERKSK
jgi:histone deacetylase complex regulatory component SIN3